jgi:hypothetical protein
LQRIAPAGSGNHPTNWYAGPPTAGWAATGDRDGDGMPDDWELDHELDPDDPADASLDNDGDGSVNLHEYRVGTDPGDPASVLKLTVLQWLGGVRLQFQVVSGRSYTLQGRDELTGGTWVNLQDFSPAQTNGFAEFTDFSTTDSPGRFYRVATPAL